MGNRHKFLEEHHNNLRAGRTALHPAHARNTFRVTNPMGRHNKLSGGDPRYMTYLIASGRSGQEENCSKDWHAGSPLQQVK